MTISKLLLSLLLSLIMVTSCSIGGIKNNPDHQGVIIEIDEGMRGLLINDPTYGKTHVSLEQINKVQHFEAGQYIQVWTTGTIRESSPIQTDAVKVKIVPKP